MTIWKTNFLIPRLLGTSAKLMVIAVASGSWNQLKVNMYIVPVFNSEIFHHVVVSKMFA